VHVSNPSASRCLPALLLASAAAVGYYSVTFESLWIGQPPTLHFLAFRASQIKRHLALFPSPSCVWLLTPESD
jgi:hypothetical protein